MKHFLIICISFCIAVSLQANYEIDLEHNFENLPTYYRDADLDGYGDPNDTSPFNEIGYILQGGDCDDTDKFIYPGATEVCDGEDNNCDGQIDEAGGDLYFFDSDGDGWAGSDVTASFCSDPGGDWHTVAWDCDDSDPEINLAANEVCDGVDNNCDGQIDENGELWGYDFDGDGFSSFDSTLITCNPFPGPGWVDWPLYAGDCDETDATVHTGAQEICDNKDNDCDGTVDEGLSMDTYWYDNDGDGWAGWSTTTTSCTSPGPDWYPSANDCDDSDPNVNPFANELCDGIDNNCDGFIDENEQLWGYDFDGDGFSSFDSTMTTCSSFTPGPGWVDWPLYAGDCDETDATVHTGAQEICDNKDNDCDGTVDEGLSMDTYWYDNDGDGWAGWSTTTTSCTSPGPDWYPSANDCDDSDPNVNPFANELCDGIDNNCDGFVDENEQLWGYDFDGDGFSSFDSTMTTCSSFTPGPGWVDWPLYAGDCDETDATVHTGAQEICDNKDNDCDGTVDEGLSMDTYWYDNDGDGWAGWSTTTTSCTSPGPDWYPSANDCDDSDPNVNPFANELCDGIDNNCDGFVDENEQLWGYDFDGDGFSSFDSTMTTCSSFTPGPGWVDWPLYAGDCDETDATVHTGAQEICDNKDNDCDGTVDEGLSMDTYWYDNDGDGWAGWSTTTTSCTSPGPDWYPSANDCDDSDPNVNPFANELCDGIDNNCDGFVDENEQLWGYDFDGDGFSSFDSTMTTCSSFTPGPGWVDWPLYAGDCDETDATVHTGAQEICDNKDNDCDGTVDEGLSMDTYWYDNDGDGWAGWSTTTTSCTSPGPDWYPSANDCDDSDPNVNPFANELCDGIDNNCDGFVDENEQLWGYDFDGDGFSSFDSTMTTCSSFTPGPGWVDWPLYAGDCDETDATVHTGAQEICDNKDNDCDGTVDEGLSMDTYWYDNDGDGWAGWSTTTTSCTSPGPDWYPSANDCDDSDPNVNPFANELCDGIDNNCDGFIDETERVLYYDGDGDGYGSTDSIWVTCDNFPGLEWVDAIYLGDCDDTDADVNPSASEICNNLDDDCDGEIDEELTCDDCDTFLTAPVDLTKSFDPVAPNTYSDRVQVKWYKAMPQVKYTDEDAAACDIKAWKVRELDPVTGGGIGPVISNPDTISLVNRKKVYPDGSPRKIFKWPLFFRSDATDNSKRIDPNFRYKFKVRCACEHGAGQESPWSETKIFNTPDFDPATGVYTPPAGFQWTDDGLKAMLSEVKNLNIYPNPSEGRSINLVLDEEIDGSRSIEVLNISGQIIEQRIEVLSGSDIKLVFREALTRGIYMLRMEVGEKVLVQRFAVQ